MFWNISNHEATFVFILIRNEMGSQLKLPITCRAQAAQVMISFLINSVHTHTRIKDKIDCLTDIVVSDNIFYFIKDEL